MTLDERIERLEQIAEAHTQDDGRLVEVMNQQTLLIEDLQERAAALGWLVALCIASSSVTRDALQSVVEGRGLDGYPIEDGVIRHVESVWQSLRPHVDEIRTREAALLSHACPAFPK